MNYAILEQGVITNVIVGHPVNNENAVCLYDIPAGIGDTYDGQYFYHNGKRIYSLAEKYIMTIDAIHTMFGIPYIEEDD